MSSSNVCVFVLLSMVVFTSGESDSRLLVETSTGVVRGKIVIGHTQSEARAFYGIPYAEPPLEKLRFKPPLPITPWAGVFDATKDPLPCYQQYTKETLRLSKMLGIVVRRPWSEDCLTLSVWTPAVVPQDAPVVVFFHDGEFLTGTGVFPNIDLSTVSGITDIVYISFNYRLGAFGFLSLGVPEYPGNLGLMDQHLALKWIHRNAASFGGKREAVFILGLGAGAASIGHQLIIRENAGLFKTVVMMDGSPTCSWAWQAKEAAVKMAKALSQNLGCNHSNASVEIECLQNAHPEDILDASQHGEVSSVMHFKPNVDGQFIREQPAEALEAGKINKVTVIQGTSYKSQSLQFFAVNKDILLEHDEGLSEEGFQQAMKHKNWVKTDIERTIISDWYLAHSSMNGTEIRDAAVEAYTDGLSTCCSDDFANYAARSGLLTYKYVSHVADPKLPAWIGAHSHVWYNAQTGETLNPKHEYGEDYRNMTMSVLFWAKISSRKTVIEYSKVVPPYNLVDRTYTVRKEKLLSLKNYENENCVLWNQVLPALRKRKLSCSAEEDI